MKNTFRSLIAIVVMTACVALSPSTDINAQITKRITIAAADDTLVNADTAFVLLPIDGSWKSVEGFVREVAGTTGGSITFEGLAPDGMNWETIGTALTLSDVTTDQFKIFEVPARRLHMAYRLKFIKSGSGSAEIRAYTVRYTGS